VCGESRGRGKRGDLATGLADEKESRVQSQRWGSLEGGEGGGLDGNGCGGSIGSSLVHEKEIGKRASAAKSSRLKAFSNQEKKKGTSCTETS